MIGEDKNNIKSKKKKKKKKKKSFCHLTDLCITQAECPPKTSDQEISADLSGKKRQGKNGKKGGGREKKRRQKRENCKKGRWKIE